LKIRYGLKTLCVKGIVSFGKGEGTKFTKLEWVKTQTRERLGFIPEPGTLNLNINKDQIQNRALLDKAEAIEIQSPTGHGRGRLFRANLQDHEVAVIIPQVPNYPEDLVEIIAPINLRRRLKLEDGASLELQILLR